MLNFDPKRLENESYEVYRARRKACNLAVKNRGTHIHVSKYVSIDRKGITHVTGAATRRVS